MVLKIWFKGQKLRIVIKFFWSEEQTPHDVQTQLVGSVYVLTGLPIVWNWLVDICFGVKNET